MLKGLSHYVRVKTFVFLARPFLIAKKNYGPELRNEHQKMDGGKNTSPA
jgi:hypothetical protein